MIIMRYAALAMMLALSACVTIGGKPIGSASKVEAITAVAQAAASIADAKHIAPPVTLGKTLIDEKAIRAAFVTFDAALTVVDAYVAVPSISGFVRNSPRSLALKHAILATKAALNAASAAQRAGNAVTYGAALADASKAIAIVQERLTS